MAFAPKSIGVVTIEVLPSDSTPASGLAIKVAIHSQVAIQDLQLTALPQPDLALRQGDAQWQGSIAAGETVVLDYQFESSAAALKPSQRLCRFDLYRSAAGMNQWLSSAEYVAPADADNVEAKRVPLQMQTDAAASARSAGTQNAATSSPRYLIEYSLD